jgi:hypothetical protein
MTHPHPAVIYTDGSQECERVSQLLQHLGGEYLEYRLNQHFTQRAFEQEFGPDATYPQVARGSRHIGNLKETLQHFQQEGNL